MPLIPITSIKAAHHLRPRIPQELLNKKDMVGDVFNQLRLARQRALNQNGVVRGCACRNGSASGRAAAALCSGVGIGVGRAAQRSQQPAWHFACWIPFG